MLSSHFYHTVQTQDRSGKPSEPEFSKSVQHKEQCRDGIKIITKKANKEALKPSSRSTKEDSSPKSRL